MVQRFGFAMVVLAAVVLGACSAQPRAVAYAVPVPAPADNLLQACADHAAAGIRAAGNQGFQRLRMDTAGLYRTPLNQTVGNTHVATVQDGYGAWYGQREWRRVRIHCLNDAAGQVLYSFVRAE